MKKDLEWLKDRVHQSSVYTDLDATVYGDKWVVSRELVVELIDQVEQPETTEEQALNKLAERYPFSSASIGAILEGHTQQGRYEQLELPVVPDNIDTLISWAKKWDKSLFETVLSADKETTKWMFENAEKFNRAWLDGYTVEEKKYKVNVEGLIILAKACEECNIHAYNDLIEYDEAYIKELTEQEIKDYDERYFAFAVPVESGDK